LLLGAALVRTLGDHTRSWLGMALLVLYVKAPFLGYYKCPSSNPPAAAHLLGRASGWGISLTQTAPGRLLPPPAWLAQPPAPGSPGPRQSHRSSRCVYRGSSCPRGPVHTPLWAKRKISQLVAGPFRAKGRVWGSEDTLSSCCCRGCRSLPEVEGTL
jgi:hypothetical protein